MFNRTKLRIQDIKTLGGLIPNAEKQANLMGEEQPGAEHFLLAAFALSDDTAKKAFERIGANPEQFKAAIQQQYKQALSAIGMDSPLVTNAPKTIISDKIFRSSKPSGKAVMQQVYALKQKDKNKPLLGAHIVAVITQIEHGITPRSLQVMGIKQDELLKAAQEEINAYQV